MKQNTVQTHDLWPRGNPYYCWSGYKGMAVNIVYGRHQECMSHHVLKDNDFLRQTTGLH